MKPGTEIVVEGQLGEAGNGGNMGQGLGWV